MNYPDPGKPHGLTTQLKVGMEVHVELATRSKMWTAAPNVAHRDHFDAAPNTLLDPVVIGLPGTLPVINRAAVEMSIKVGLALNCSIAPVTKWDRKSYYYPDLPKNYQISQFDRPLCFDGALDIPPGSPQKKTHEPLANEASVSKETSEDTSKNTSGDASEVTLGATPGGGGPGGSPASAGVSPTPSKNQGNFPNFATQRIRITRAHLEEDAGKLLHDLPGGGFCDGSLVDLNRAGTPLLEIVTEPDFTSPDDVVTFGQMLRDICRHLGVTEGIMQKGHMRFEPNINVIITNAAGETFATPVVEIKNLNSFKAVHGAIVYEHHEQVQRWLDDGKVMGARAKSTRGWDDAKLVTTPQREKEDADEYRYFPDPDLVTLKIGQDWLDAIQATLPELPAAKKHRYVNDFGLKPIAADNLLAEPANTRFFEACVDAAGSAGQPRRLAAMLLNAGAKRANEQGVFLDGLGITPQHVADIVALQDADKISATAADTLFGHACTTPTPGNTPGSTPGSAPRSVPGETPGTIAATHPATENKTSGAQGAVKTAEQLAEQHGLLQVSDDGALDEWIAAVLADPKNEKAIGQIKEGKDKAIGALLGQIMKLSKGQANPKVVGEKIKTTLRGV